MTLFGKTEKLFIIKLFFVFIIFGLSAASVLSAPPNVVDQNYSSAICSFSVERQIQVVASDNENDPITFELISGLGTIDPNSGIISYTANNVGVETFVVTASDLEGTTQATITDQLTQNSSPLVTGMQDSSYYLCSPQTVYVPVTISDPDNNIENISFNNGYFDSQNSVLEFIPFDSGWYEIIVTATDSCGEMSSDTANIHISNDNSLLFDVPNDTTLFICETGTYYFPITYSGAPEGTIITVDGINTWYDADSNAVVFASECGITNEITVTVETPCWTYEKIFTVTIICNSEPYIALPVDFTTSACIGGEICIPIGISDIDDNVSEVVTNLTDGIVYNPKFHTVCFTADTLGIYAVEITVIDACGASSTDLVNVNVIANTPPVLTYTPDITLFRQCVFEEICLPVGVSDIDSNLDYVSGNVGYYNYNTNEFCFTPDTAGQYSIIVTAVDSCGDFDEIVIDLTVEQGDYVDVEIQDADFDLCGPQMVCIPVNISGAYDSVNVNLGTFANNEICFMADAAGSYTLNIEAFAECNSMSSSAVVEVRIDPRLVCPDNLDTLLCEATTLAFDYESSVLVDSIKVTAPAYLESGQVMVPIDADGIYEITMTAYSECGIDECAFEVDAIINNAPVLVAGDDLEIRVCSFSEVCLEPFTLYDTENNIDSVVTNYGSIQNNRVCFTPNTLREYEVIMTAYDACGAVGADTVIVTTVLADYVRVQCSDDSFSLCDPGQICYPVDVDGIYDSVIVNYGSYFNGQVCFDADTAGIYTINVTGYAECNVSSCQADVEIKIDPILSCPNIPSDIFMCGADTLVYDFQISDLVDSVKATAPAYIIGQQIYIPVVQSGNINVTITAYSVCGIESCNLNINSIFNSAPFIYLGDDIEISRCSTVAEQFGFTLLDVDENIDSIVTSSNVDSVVGDYFFIEPDDFGVEEIIITVYDACGAVDSDTTVITFIQEGFAYIEPFPGPVFDTICFADTIKIENFVITPNDAFVTIWPNGSYDTLTQTLSIFIANEGIYPVKVRAETPCADDSVEFDLNIHIPVVPEISCPVDPIDTLVCVDSLEQVCVPIEITGTGVVVDVNNGAVYEDGNICFNVDTAGLYDFEITGTNYCGSDICQINVNVVDDEAPQLFLPSDIFIERCPQDTSQICIDGISSTDSRSQTYLYKECGPGVLELFGADSGKVCFWPDTLGTYSFCISTTDGCKQVVDTFNVIIQDKGDCDVCVRMTIDGGECAAVGTAHNVAIKVETNDYITGFDIFLEYDVSVMSFQSAMIAGGSVEEWEYFTFRYGLDDCGASCPPGLIKLVGIADKETVAGSPPINTLKPDGTLVNVSFRIANDQNLNGQFLPINFFWYYCNDNTFTSLNSDSTYFENRIYNFEGVLIWDEEDDINYPEVDRVFGTGMSDACLNDASLLSPRRCAEFYNGGICVSTFGEQS
ncbi:MAG: cadherin repeat domain-containing protein, partial [candidate division Zixibacteria bacterium]|nr:cadherin repeat domain-containing protein [candidate division Zixibacteria bacterium]